MSKVYCMYPNVVSVPGQNFSREKVLTVPQQNMSLKEIIRRFTRRESLPISHDGVYIENMGDLEKMAYDDIFVKHERIAALKSALVEAEKVASKRFKDVELAKAVAKAVESASVGTPPPGAVTGGPIVAQAPPP